MSPKPPPGSDRKDLFPNHRAPARPCGRPRATKRTRPRNGFAGRVRRPGPVRTL